MSRTTINLNNALHKKLDQLAQMENRTLTNLIETLLLRSIEKGNILEVSSEKMGNFQPNPHLSEIVKRIIASVHPQKIILFGSAARGSMGPNSDLDLLVIMPVGHPRRKTAQKIYQNLIGVGFAVDVVVVTQDDIKKIKNNTKTVIQPALTEGKLLYAA